MEDRSKFYKKPFKFGAQTIYVSDLLDKISLEHWEEFDNAVKSGEGHKIGDIIDISVNLTARQLIKFLDEIKKMNSVEEIHRFADDKILEIAKEVKLE